MYDSAVITANVLPLVFTISGGGSYCASTPGVVVGLSYADAGVNYQLYNGTATVGASLPGTGGALSFGLQPLGVYTVIGVNATTGCSNNMLGSATVTLLPSVTPSVTVTTGVGDTVCDGTLVNFTALAVNGGTAPTYQWYVNGNAVLGANGETFSVNVTPKAYNGAKVKVVASVAGASATSSEAILTVNDDKEAPTVKRVSGSDTFNSITVTFSEPVVDPSALDASKYSVAGLTLSSPVRVNDRTIKLTTSKQDVAKTYTVTVKGVLDLASNASNFTGTFTSYEFLPGVAAFSLWLNQGGGFDTFPKDQAPDQVRIVNSYFTGTGLYENYFGQLKGVFTAPKTGDYVFWMASDDHGELYLSTDENPANKKKIAEEPQWCDPQYWKTDGGANSGTRGEDGQITNRSDQYPGTEWATGAEHPWFARNAVNRLWSSAISSPFW